MEKKDNKYLYVLTLILAVAVVGLSVAYAALSSTLTASFNTVSQGVASWDVGFQTGSVTAVAGGTSDVGRVCGTATVTKATVTIADTTLSKPGDSCRYDLVVKNLGSISAKLAEINFTKPDNTCTTTGTTMVCDDITYKLTTDQAGNTPLAINSVLAASTGSQPVYLTVMYSGLDVAASASSLSTGGFSLIYNQN